MSKFIEAEGVRFDIEKVVAYRMEGGALEILFDAPEAEGINPLVVGVPEQKAVLKALKSLPGIKSKQKISD